MSTLRRRWYAACTTHTAQQKHAFDGVRDINGAPKSARYSKHVKTLSLRGGSSIRGTSGSAGTSAR